MMSEDASGYTDFGNTLLQSEEDTLHPNRRHHPPAKRRRDTHGLLSVVKKKDAVKCDEIA